LFANLKVTVAVDDLPAATGGGFVGRGHGQSARKVCLPFHFPWAVNVVVTDDDRPAERTASSPYQSMNVRSVLLICACLAAALWLLSAVLGASVEIRDNVDAFIDAQDAPKEMNIGERRRLTSSIYLGASRAERDLHISCCETRGGGASVLALADKGGSSVAGLRLFSHPASTTRIAISHSHERKHLLGPRKTFAVHISGIELISIGEDSETSALRINPTQQPCFFWPALFWRSRSLLDARDPCHAKRWAPW
jgi:hypothetical protein